MSIITMRDQRLTRGDKSFSMCSSDDGTSPTLPASAMVQLIHISRKRIENKYIKEGKLHLKEIKFALMDDWKLKCCV